MKQTDMVYINSSAAMVDCAFNHLTEYLTSLSPLVVVRLLFI